MMAEFLSSHWLDLFTTILGILYILLEYKASIALWYIGMLMPALDIYLYYSHGLYGDAGMAVYYTLAAVYGFLVWKFSRKRENKELPITHLPVKRYLPVFIFFAAAWAATWFVLVKWTNSTVPVLDAFTNAMSFVGLWALAHKYVEQWIFWIAVDAICAYLYIVKGIPFKALLYSLYVAIAIAGYLKWKKMVETSKTE